MSTYYDVLKTDRSATVADLKEAYRRVQFESHPDKNGHLSERERVSREEMCKLANVAYEVFSDTHARRKYDAALSVGESDSTSPSLGVLGGFLRSAPIPPLPLSVGGEPLDHTEEWYRFWNFRRAPPTSDTTSPVHVESEKSPPTASTQQQAPHPGSHAAQ
jgi:curved DNA-binding protein CbpA